MDLLEDIRNEIEHGHMQETVSLIRQALAEGISIDAVIEQSMMPAMQMAGESLKDGTEDLPLLLSAARCIRLGFEVFEQENEEFRQRCIGSVILGTVEGDLHDIGKNLVALMLRSEGIRVYDLGVDVASTEFFKAVREHPEASAVCLSSLLTTSLPELQSVVKRLRTISHRKFKIIVGGGAVTGEFAAEIGADAYAESAVDTARIAKSFLNIKD